MRSGILRHLTPPEFDAEAAVHPHTWESVCASRQICLQTLGSTLWEGSGVASASRRRPRISCHADSSIASRSATASRAAEAAVHPFGFVRAPRARLAASRWTLVFARRLLLMRVVSEGAMSLKQGRNQLSPLDTEKSAAHPRASSKAARAWRNLETRVVVPASHSHSKALATARQSSVCAVGDL